jgi:NTE family protein
MSENATTKVAIACQGGGSHTAFTAGILRRLLPAVDESDEYDLVGLSGTSGGAFSAVGGWYGLRAGDATAPDVLADLWADIAARNPLDRLANDAVVWGATWESMGFPTPEVTPYQTPFDDWGQHHLRRVLESHVDFDGIPRLVTDDAPDLLVGAVDITEGEFRTFENANVTVQSVLASAAVPELYEAVEIDGDHYWDGLLSQNPPIRDLFHVPADRKPDELWIVQINPQTRDGEPRSLREIVDRRNELAGNLSLNQELHMVRRVNEWVDQGHLPDDQYKHTTIRRLQLADDLDYASKLDRTPSFIDALIERGEETAGTFLTEQGM